MVQKRRRQKIFPLIGLVKTLGVQGIARKTLFKIGQCVFQLRSISSLETTPAYHAPVSNLRLGKKKRVNRAERPRHLLIDIPSVGTLQTSSVLYQAPFETESSTLWINGHYIHKQATYQCLVHLFIESCHQSVRLFNTDFEMLSHTSSLLKTTT